MPQPIGSEFVQMLTGCQNRLYAFVFSLIGNADHAEDVVQETNRVAWENAADFEMGSNFNAWVFQVAFNQVCTHRRKVQRDRLSFDDDMLQTLASEVSTFDSQTDDWQQALTVCLEKLQPHHEKMIRQRYFHGLGVNKIATSLGRTANSVSVTLFRLRAALMECIEQAVGTHR